MNASAVEQEVRRLASVEGVLSCSLVDVETGMVVHSVTHTSAVEPLAEAARDYWRLHDRNGKMFSPLGPLAGIVVAHEQGTINLLPCGRGMVLITLAERSRVNFSTWPVRIALLRGLLQQQFAET